MQIDLLPWMRAVKQRMVVNLNRNSCHRYGDKLFEVSTTVCNGIKVQTYYEIS